MAKILLADDDESMRTLVEHIVREMGHDFVAVTDGMAVFDAYAETLPDLLIVDIMMPRLNGFDVCSALRAQNVSQPIIILTAKGDIVDKSVGFKAGADDYLVKPFIPEELELRIEALLRRSAQRPEAGFGGDQAIAVDGLEIDVRRRKVKVGGAPVELTPKEFHLLRMLAGSPGEVFTRDQLVEEIWGPEYAGDMTGITVLVRRLRQKIEENPSEPRYIQTVWHVGYRFGD